MHPIPHAVQNFWRDADGVSAIEYALLAALIAMAVLGGVSLLGQQVNILYTHIKDCVVNLACS